MVVLEALVVGEIPRTSPIEHGADEAWDGVARRGSSPGCTRRSFFGCPATTISPSRWTSTPTESMFVARSTSIGRRWTCLFSFVRARAPRRVGIERLLEPIEHHRDVRSKSARGELLEVPQSGVRRAQVAGDPARDRRGRRACLTSSSTSRRIPPSSRSELK